MVQEQAEVVGQTHAITSVQSIKIWQMTTI